jgi:hypothetical protein
MPKNKIDDLRNHLFETIELLKDGDIDIEKANAIASVAQTVINLAKVEVDYIKTVGGFGTRSPFIPLEELKAEEVNNLRLVK